MGSNGLATKVTAIGDASLTGWRRRLVDPVANAVSKRSGLSADQVRALVGLALLGLSLYSLAKRATRVKQHVT